MEIKDELKKPYTEKERADFIVKNNHQNGYEIKETEEALLAIYNEPTIEEQNEQIRRQRQARYEAESDPIRLDYDEALARGEETAEQLKQDWLASKDKIREELPYIEEQEEEDGTTDVA